MVELDENDEGMVGQPPLELEPLDTDPPDVPEGPDEYVDLRNQRNFNVFRERYVTRLKDQLRALDETLRTQQNEYDKLEKEEEDKADWMWDVQTNYAKLEKDLQELDARRVHLKNEAMKSEEAHTAALKQLNQEEKYIADLQLNEAKNQQEIKRLDELCHRYFKEKEESYKNAKIVDSSVNRQRKELQLTKLEKRKTDFEIYRLQRQISAAEERFEFRRTLKRQRQEDLENLKKQKMEANGDLDVVLQQSAQVSRSLEYDMRALEEKNSASATLAAKVKECNDTFKGLVAETNGVKKDIRNLQYQHEQLTNQYLRTQRDLFQNEKKIESCQQDTDRLLGRYSASDRTLKLLNERADEFTKLKAKTEQDLQFARERLSVEVKKKQEADLAFQEAQMENKGHLKAVRYAMEEYKRLGDVLNQLEEDISIKDYDNSQQAILRIELTNQINQQKEILERINNEVKDKERELKEATAAVEKESANIDRRQERINKLNVRMEELIEAAGGTEISPIEAQIAELRQTNTKSENLHRQLNSDWLRYQNSIVQLSEKRDKLHALATDLDNQSFIASYKLQRLNKEIAQVEAECREYEKTDKAIRENIAKNSEKLFKFSQQEKELILKSMDLEHVSIENLHREEVLLAQDKESLDKCMKALKDVEEEIYATKQCTLMWERKLELKKQAKKAIEQDFSKTELEELRNEVHKLELDKATLEREQAKVTQEMIFAAERRDQLHTAARRRAVEGEGPSVKKLEQMIERKNREIQALQKEIKAVIALQEDCRKRLEIFQKRVEEQTKSADDLEIVWDSTTKEKNNLLKQRFHIRLDNFIAQQYGKHYLMIKSNKVAKKNRPKGIQDLQEQSGIMKQKYEALLKVIDETGQQFPVIFDDRKSQTSLVEKKR